MPKGTSGPFSLEVSSTFESVEGGTNYSGVVQVDASGLFKIAEPIVRRMIVE